MAGNHSPQFKIIHPGWLAVAAALLVLVAAGLLLWFDSGPTMRTTGHGWFEYPETTERTYPETTERTEDGSSRQGDDWPENVVLLSLEEREQVAKGRETREHFVESLCHILLVLPDGAPKATGGGSGSNSGVLHHSLRWSAAAGEQMREDGIEVRFRLADETLGVEGQKSEYPLNPADPRRKRPPAVERDPHGPFSTASGNVFLVRLDGNHDVAAVTPLGQSITFRIDAAQLEHLLEAKTESGL